MIDLKYKIWKQETQENVFHDDFLSTFQMLVISDVAVSVSVNIVLTRNKTFCAKYYTRLEDS